MRAAYVDTSCLVAIDCGSTGVPMARRPASFDRLFSANMLDAEFRATCVREDVPSRSPLLDRLEWILPDRPLDAEITNVLATGYVRGADAWRLACGLWLAPQPGMLTFLTVDTRQRAVARRLGFTVQ